MLQAWPSPANRLGRAALSLVCAVFASVIVCSVVIACNYEEFSRSLTSWFVFIRGAVLIIALAWVVTLPLVLLISRFNGWRLWFLAASGTSMGPALLIVLNLCIRLAKPSQTFDIVEGWKIQLVATAISLIATALYLGTLRFSTRGDAL
jgi:predicted MFS family arabinose efflux permease